ncbi:DNA-directed RNA polymerases II and IV subunit 5A [Fagus crenata]
MALSEDETNRLFRIRKTVMQMLRDRGYLVADFEVDMTKDQFRRKYGDSMKREDLVINKSKRNVTSNQIYAFFPEEPKVGVKTMKTYTNRMKSECFQSNLGRSTKFNPLCEDLYKAVAMACLLCTFPIGLGGSDVAHSCNMMVEEFLQDVPKEIFDEAELMINIKEHVLIPEHQMLNIEEKKTLLERYTVKETQLPRIQVTDPIARYYGLKRGQVVKIIRPSETADRYFTYRFVV